MSYIKEIAPHYEINGKRRKLTGFDGILRDGDTVVHNREYSSYSEAENRLDLLTYELLSNLGDTAEQLDGGQVADDVELVCETCQGEGRIPAYGCGDQAGGFAETCPDCDGRPHEISFAELPTIAQLDALMATPTPILTDCHAVISMALGNQPAKDVVPELRRVLARIKTLLPTV